jgi:hypothetical protein
MLGDRPGSRIGALALLAVLLGAGSAFAGGSDPEVVLDEIYGQVDAMCGGEGQGPGYDIYAIAEIYFAPDLAQPFEKAMESGDLGFDVLIDGQDCRISDLQLEVVDTDGDVAVGRAMFKNMGEDRIIDLQMRKAGEAWKVSDIVYQHRPFSLREAL